MESMSETGDCVKTEVIDDLNRDETHIRRPPNAFMIFGQQFRKVLAKKFKNLSNKEISKLLGDEWRRMDGLTKNNYHKLADEAHRRHLEKYPGYYYSPLEARQRKAERKRKLKMSRIANHNTADHKTINSVVGPLCGNRPNFSRNSMYPMVRPILPFHPRMVCGQQFYRFQPNYPFGGLIPFRPFAMPLPCFMGQSMTNQSFNSTDSSTPCLSQTSEISLESEPRKVVTHKSESQLKDSVENPDIGLLSTLLPPMHNPNIEATPVHQNEEFLSDQNSMNSNEVTKMTNAIVDQEFRVKEEAVEIHYQSVVMDSKPICRPLGDC